MRAEPLLTLDDLGRHRGGRLRLYAEACERRDGTRARGHTPGTLLGLAPLVALERAGKQMARTVEVADADHMFDEVGSAHRFVSDVAVAHAASFGQP
jgi:hypothetical protein